MSFIRSFLFLFFLFCIAEASTRQVIDIWSDENPTTSESLSSPGQTKDLYDFSIQQISGQKPYSESLTMLNQKLEAMKLPTVNILEIVTIRLTPIYGMMGVCTAGIEIEDDQHVFCLPCVKNLTQFYFGVYKKAQFF